MHQGCKSIGHLMAKTRNMIPTINILTAPSTFILLNTEEFCLQCIRKCNKYEYRDYEMACNYSILQNCLLFLITREKCTNKWKPIVSVPVTGSPQRHKSGLQYHR